MINFEDERITLAFQYWNSEYRWFTPNNHPKNWIINGKKEIPFSHNEYYFKFWNHDSKNLRVNKNSLLDSVYTEKKLLENIPLGKKYILPIFIHKIDYFYKQDPYGFKFISPRVRNDVAQGLAKIVLIFPYEGNTAHTIKYKYGGFVTEGSKILDRWCQEANFQKNQVYFLNANLYADEHNKIVKNYTSKSLDIFITWLPRDYMFDEFKFFKNFNPINNQYLFLSYNRQDRIHRDILMLSLHHKKLLDKGLISYNNNIDSAYLETVSQYFPIKHLLSNVDCFFKKIPLKLDFDLDTNNPASQITDSHYEQTFISIVSETHWEKETLFRSEKIYKTLAAGHPFLVLSSPYFLKSLKELGFQTFDKWIDESYDDELDLCKRIDKITNEILRFSKMSLDELRLIREEMKMTVYYNQRLILKMYKKQKENCPLIEQLKTIWKEMH